MTVAHVLGRPCAKCGNRERYPSGPCVLCTGTTVIAEDVRTDDEGNVLGDRIRIIITEDDWVNLVHESMQKHSDENERHMDWDWKVDPEAGISMSIAHAKEMMVALSRLLT